MMAGEKYMLLLCILSNSVLGISSLSDQITCKDVQCPSLANFKCPPDSILHKTPPKASLNNNGAAKLPKVTVNDLPVNNLQQNSTDGVREKREVTTTFDPNVDLSSSTEPLPTTQAQATDTETSTNITEMCCPKAQCVCKEICDVPSCQNTSLVLVEVKPRSNIPGECCAQFDCAIKPNCTEVIDTKSYWLIDCQICQCFAGQTICHRSCDEIRRPPNNCLSENLKRSFSHGETWKEDECTQCECKNGENKCLTSFCRPIHCHNKIKVQGECCPICPNVTAIVEDNIDLTTEPAKTVNGTITPKEPCSSVKSPAFTPLDGVQVIQYTEKNCYMILYIIIVALAVLWLAFMGLYFHERSKQRSYRPVPIFDSNCNKIMSISSS